MLSILAEETFIEQNYSVSFCIIKLDKSYLVLVTDQVDYGLAQVVMGVPPTLEGTRANSAPGLLFGFEKDTLSRTISEICATKLKKPTLVLYNVHGLERKEIFVTKIIIKALKEIIKKIELN